MVENMCIFHMENFHAFWSYQHRDHVYPVLHTGPPESRHPDQRRAPQLLEFIEIHGARRPAKAEVGSRLYFHKRDRSPPLDHQVQVPMAVLEPVRQDAPAPLYQPAGGDAFAEEA